jgi:putative AlgH/UPF0301 family transcriptional regulator
MSSHEEALSDEEALCRFCFEGSSHGELVSPCECKGDQRFVHLTCLRRWQSELSGGSSAAEARRCICPVCRRLYDASYTPAPPTRREPAIVDRSDTVWPPAWFVGLVLLSTLAYWEASHPMRILGTSGLAVALLLALQCGFSSWFQRLLSVRFCFVVDQHGVPMLRLVRVGAPVQGLAAGALLVATDRIGGGFFERTVIVLTKHDSHGTVGLVINCAADGRPGIGFDGAPPLRDALEVPEAPCLVQHGLGGPVDIGDSTVLHKFGDRIPGAQPLLANGRDTGVYVGGQLTALKQKTCEAAAALRAARVQQQASGRRNNGTAAASAEEGQGPAELLEQLRANFHRGLEQRPGIDEQGLPRWAPVQREEPLGEPPPVTLRVLYGHAAWAPGQLAGEIRANAWTWAADIGPAFAMRGGNGPLWLEEAQPIETWERALAAVAVERRAGRPTGSTEIGNVPARLDPGV